MKKYHLKPKAIIAIIILVITIILILLITAIYSKKSIVGKWKAINSQDEYYYIFNKDKTCSYEMKVARLDCTYKIDENKLIITYKGNDKSNTFKYEFKKNSLIIIDEKSNYNEFIKEKENKKSSSK